MGERVTIHRAAADTEDVVYNPETLSIVIPLYNEQDNVQALVDRVHEGLVDCRLRWELICVDDGSRDATWDRLTAEVARRGAHVKPIRLSRNFGQTAAMQAGIDAARGELIATMDGDLQNDPADIHCPVRSGRNRSGPAV